MDTWRPEALRGLILDMDGVLWRANEPIGDLVNSFNTIAERGLKVVLATNNSMLSAGQYLTKLAGFGVRLEPHQIITSSQTAAYFLKRLHLNNGRVFPVGERGLEEALREQGFIVAETDVSAVVVGLDRNINYQKLSQAADLVRSGVHFVATNADGTYPVPGGLIPGAGAIVAAIQAASGRAPYIVGKPAPEMYQVAMERMDVSPEETLVVGDRLETDIAGAQKIGCRSALVLSGVTTRQMAFSWQPPPDLIAEDLTALLEQI